MARLERIPLAYAVAFVAFLVLPAALRTQAPAPLPVGLYWQELVDLLTPVVLIPLSWLLCALDDDEIPATPRDRILFLVLAALWVEGQGMHLAANSLNRNLDPNTAFGALAHFYDEVLSHYTWHLGIVGIWGLAIVRSLRSVAAGPARPSRAGFAAAGLLGLAWWMVLIESGTAILDVPLTAAGLLLVVLARRRGRAVPPIAAILGAAAGVTIVLVAAWAIIWGGRLPQFTEVGLL